MLWDGKGMSWDWKEDIQREKVWTQEQGIRVWVKKDEFGIDKDESRVGKVGIWERKIDVYRRNYQNL